MCKPEYTEQIQKLANKSSMKHKCGALMIYRNKIIAVGYNKHNSNNLRCCFLWT